MRSQRPVPRSLEGIHFAPPDPPAKPDYRSDDGNVFVRAVRGRASLAVVWWGIGLPLRIAIALFTGDWTFEVLYGGSTTVQRVVSCTSLVFTAIWSFMAWRCAPNVEERGWTWVARGILVYIWARFAYDLIA